MRKANLARDALAGCLLWAALSGCALGPTALEVNRARYNHVIQQTTSEQLLLNLVRLQYRESPLFLGVGSVSAQFEFGQSANVSGTINEGPNPINPDDIGLGAAVRYTEKPTITFAPLQGREFVSQLLAPLPLDSILLLSHSGWSIDRILRLTVQRINGLDNAPTASGPTPARAPRYKEFARLSRLLREMQAEGLLEIGYEPRQDELPLSLPSQNIDLLDVVEADKQGYRFRSGEDGETLILSRSSEALMWRISPAAAHNPAVAEIVELLGLRPGRAGYEIQRTIAGQPDVTVERGERTQINIATRSLMGTLFYLSQAVETPVSHRRKGVVTTTLRADGRPFDWTLVTGDLLRIHSQPTPPIDAAVAVRHRAYWYYIGDADLTSKSTFGLLSELFAYQAGAVEAVAPSLTLPVGG